MAEERIIYKGNPSAVAIFGSLVLSVLLFLGIAAGLIHFRNQFPQTNVRYGIYALLLIPLFIVLSRWSMLKFITYEITSERIKLTKGLFSKRTDELELYRVKDTSLIEPFFYRMFSVGNISIVTGDATTPALELRAVKNAKEIREQLRACVEECRGRKRTGIVELE
ncbi:MAG: PH domain-containing protein [Verrucomicrobiota bacterium]